LFLGLRRLGVALGLGQTARDPSMTAPKALKSPELESNEAHRKGTIPTNYILDKYIPQ
jgi:hypothetical protein